MAYTDDTWALATDEEKAAEFERCKDPVYCYNNYYKTADMPTITREEWVNKLAMAELCSIKWRRGKLSQAYIELVKDRIRKEYGYEIS